MTNHQKGFSFDKRPEKKEFERCVCGHGGHRHEVQVTAIFNGLRKGGRGMMGYCEVCMCPRLIVKEKLTLTEYFSRYGNT